MFLKALHFCALSLGFFIVFTNLPKSPSVDFNSALQKDIKSVDCFDDQSLDLPADHVCALIDVWHTIHESFESSESLSEVTLRVVAVV